MAGTGKYNSLNVEQRDNIGSVLCGKYKVLDVLGSGGSSDVLLVAHLELGTLFAMKVLTPWTSNRPNAVERFRREAAIVQAFNHPGTVQLRDFGRTEDGRLYLLTDYAEGDTLSDIVEEGDALSITRCLDIVEELLEILSDAHNAGILHRDVKPSNVVCSDIGVKLVDFGIASIFDGIGEQKKITVQGAVLGTPEFMAPEISLGECEPDARSDLYSVGVLLYEALSGELPIEGENMLQTLIKQATAAPKPLPENPQIPDFVRSIVSKALRKEPARRYQSAADFAQDCRRARTLIDSSLERSKNDFVFEDDSFEEIHDSSDVEDARYTIACLDDDPIFLNLLRHVLETEGYNVIALNGCSGIYDLFHSGKADLLLCDEQMPGLSGAKVCSLLKTVLPETKIFLYSALEESQLEQRAEEANVDGWGSKGRPIKTLTRALRELLQS